MTDVRKGRRFVIACLLGLAPLVAVVATSSNLASAGEGYFRPPCRSGSANLGHRAGRILFTVRCVRRHGHKFGFVIGRGDRRGKHVTISAFSLKPSTRGPGAVYKRGRCQRLRQQMACDAYADGRVTLRGWFDVPIGRQCRSEISITQAVPSRCDPNKGEVCPAVLRISRIFDGIPRGC